MFIKSKRSLTTAALAIAAAGAFFLTAQSAEAGHKYGYTGRCYSFHGEEHAIDALTHMDAAFFADCNRTRILETIEARNQLMAAYRESCHEHAKHEYLDAFRDLSRYIGGGDEHHLDHAQGHILAALASERQAHARVSHHPHHDVHSPTAHGKQVPSYDRHGRSSYNRSNVTLRGRHYSIGFSF